MGVCFPKNGKRKVQQGKKKGNMKKPEKKQEINLEDKKSNNINNNLEKNKDNEVENDKSSNVINIKEEKEKFRKKLEIINNDIKERIGYYNEIKSNIKSYKSEINKSKDIDIDIDKNDYMNYESVKRKKKTIKDLEKEIDNEINNIETLLDKIQNKEEGNNHIKIINDNLKELENCLNNPGNAKSPENCITKITDEMNQLEEMNEKINNDYQDSMKKIGESKTKINDKINQYKKEKEELDRLLEIIKEHKKFLNNSMFLYIKDPINQPSRIEEITKGEELLINNFNEKCYVYEKFDLYDRNFEYQAFGLPKRTFLGVNEIPLTKNRIIKIIEFTIDDKEIKYNYDEKNSTLKFDLINLKNLEIKKVHLKYSQNRKLTEEQKRQRKIYIEDEYGISKNLNGRNAVFHLIIKNDMEVISFDKEIFIKVGEGNYKIEGLIPEEGKKTRVIISKKRAKYKVTYIKKIATKDNKNIKDTELKLHYYFEEGGNKKNEININKTTNPPNNIKNINKENREYEIKFFNINQKLAEDKIKGELINNCSGEWACDLTEEQIEKKFQMIIKIIRKN